MSKPTLNMVIGCSSCTESDCPLSDPTCSTCPEGHPVISGWLFACVCSLVFLFPIALAATGSFLFSTDKTQGLLAGVLGFLMGSIISTLITRICSIEK